MEKMFHLLKKLSRMKLKKNTTMVIHLKHNKERKIKVIYQANFNQKTFCAFINTRTYAKKYF